MKKLFFTLLPTIILIYGCSSKPPKIEATPAVSLMNAPQAPANENLSASFKIYKTPTSVEELQENVISRKNFRVKDNAKVVISVPVEQQRQEQKRALDNKIRQSGYGSGNKTQTQKDLEKSSQLDQGGDTTFSTAEYFNKAEQQIEKSLLRKNFIVMDRSKFEAKLRDRREKDRGSSDSEARQSEINNIEELSLAKRITSKEKTKMLQEMENKYGTRSKSGGREAGVNELVDISELIRAAQEGKNQADYILQVNSFDIGPISDRQLYISEQPKIQPLLLEHPALIDAMDTVGAATIVQPGYFGYLNAKLIDVKTGSIVWVGEHRVESENVTDINVSLTMSRQVDNESQVQGAVKSYNYSLNQQERATKQAGASTQVQGLDNDVQMQRVTHYNKMLANFKRLLSLQPQLPEWHYTFNVAQPVIKPSFPSEFTLRNLERESNKSQQKHSQYLRVKDRMGRHQTNLAKLVSKELIATIPVMD